MLRERHGGAQGFRLSHYCELIAGTSTGAIINLVAPAPLISYLRYNVPLTQEALTQLGMSMSDDTIEGLSAMDDPGNMTTLQDVGARAARQQVRAEDFSSHFDLVG